MGEVYFSHTNLRICIDSCLNLYDQDMSFHSVIVG